MYHTEKRRRGVSLLEKKMGFWKKMPSLCVGFSSDVVKVEKVSEFMTKFPSPALHLTFHTINQCPTLLRNHDFIRLFFIHAKIHLKRQV